MAKSDFVERLDFSQGEVNRFLNPLGFRKKGRTHNRRVEDGMAHVVNFQMGDYPNGATFVVGDLTVDMFGKFCSNLAVFCRACTKPNGALRSRSLCRMAQSKKELACSHTERMCGSKSRTNRGSFRGKTFHFF